MILVTLGTQDKDFSRILDLIQHQIDIGNIKDRVVVQVGNTKYQSREMEMFDLISMEELENLTKEADLIITHGGVGSIISGLKNNKKIIACPRLKKYKEHTNNHQLQIINKFEKEGYILSLMEDDKLEDVLKKAKTFKPKRFRSNTKNMIKIIKDYIDNN